MFFWSGLVLPGLSGLGWSNSCVWDDWHCCHPRHMRLSSSGNLAQTYSWWQKGPQQQERAYCMLSHFIHVQLFALLGTVAHEASLSMGFSRQEYWSGLPCPPPGDLPNPEIEPVSPALQADSLPTEASGKASGILEFLKVLGWPKNCFGFFH